MKAITLQAHFDGERIQLDEPFELKRNSRLAITVLPPEESTEAEDWTHLACRALEGAYGEDEPEYSLDLIKEPNPEYERR
jgi:hypothetical protein